MWRLFNQSWRLVNRIILFKWPVVYNYNNSPHLLKIMCWRSDLRRVSDESIGDWRVSCFGGWAAGGAIERRFVGCWISVMMGGGSYTDRRDVMVAAMSAFSDCSRLGCCFVNPTVVLLPPILHIVNDSQYTICVVGQKGLNENQRVWIVNRWNKCLISAKLMALLACLCWMSC
jgi:hypothetical protein